MPNGTFSLTVNHQHAGRKRVLLIGFEPSIQESISVLLNTMGWTSILSDLVRLEARLQHGSFEAVLLSLKHSAEELERMILQIKEIRPTLSERMVVVSRGAVAPEILELIECYDLSYLPQEKVFSGLLSTLEDLVAFPPWYRVAARNVGVARLLYDSLRMHGPIGVRSSYTSGRRFIYEHNNTTIDVQFDVQPGSDRISLMGQVLDGTKQPLSYENRAVILHAQNGTLARTTTNRQGEFVMQFDFAENVNLKIRVGERSWISVPSIQLDWAREQMRRRSGT